MGVQIDLTRPVSLNNPEAAYPGQVCHWLSFTETNRDEAFHKMLDRVDEMKLKGQLEAMQM